MPAIVAPSLLAADFLHLGHALDLIDASAAGWIHFDVMDGRFVPNISFGLPVLRAVARVARKPIDVHLMIVEPDAYLEAFERAGAQRLTVHQEACTHLDRSLRHIRELGMASGVALNPATPVSTLRHVLPLLDQVLIMTVNPGFGGQSFISYTLDKVRELRQMIDAAGLSVHIEVDGGVDRHTAPGLVAAGADVLVAGSAVFGAPDPMAMIDWLAAC
ncbi:MAG: ribulose-phosphate 3-epimerase [Bacteroidia bacterium]